MTVQGIARRLRAAHWLQLCAVGGLWLAAATPATAQGLAAQAPTLSGEVLPASICCDRAEDGPIVIGRTSFPYATCDDTEHLDEPIRISFTASGPTSDTASYNPPPPTGAEPYPGSYRLHATIELGPQIVTPDDPPRFYRRIVRTFSATFTIHSAAGQVVGKARLAPQAVVSLECFVGESAVMTVPLRYEAIIARPGGAVVDSGDATFALFLHEDPLIESVSVAF